MHPFVKYTLRTRYGSKSQDWEIDPKTDSHRINQLRGSSVHAACLTEEFMVGLGQFKTFCPPQLQSLSEGSGGLLLSLVLASVL